MNIGYKLYKNAMPATAEKAPYLGMAIPAGSLAYDNILKEMVRTGTRMTRPTAKYFLEALYEYAAETIARESVRINVGTVSIFPMIDGSFDSEDGEFDPARNSLYVGATLSQELRDRIAGIAPDYAGEKSVGTVRLHSCLDLTTKAFKAISGTDDFRLAGENLTVPDGSDESLGLYAKNGVDKVTDIEISETDGGQRITCHLKQAGAAIPKGTYKVRLASHGLDPTDPLAVCTLTVTLLEDIPAAPEGPYFVEPTDELELAEGGEIVIAGGNLPERSQWNPSDGNSFLTTVVDAAGETVYEEREILDEDLGPATGPDKVVVLGDILKDMIAESAGEEPSPGDVFTVSVWAKTNRGTADEKTSNVVTFTAKVPA